MKKILMGMFLMAAIPALAQVSTGGSGNAPMYLFNSAYNLTATPPNFQGNSSGVLGTEFVLVGTNVSAGSVVYVTDLGLFVGTSGQWSAGPYGGGSGTVWTNHGVTLYGNNSFSATGESSPGQAQGSFSSILATVTVTNGTPVDANGFAWITLPSPVPLIAGNGYLLLETNTADNPDPYLTPFDSSGDDTVMTVGGVGVNTAGGDTGPFFINEAAYANGSYAYSLACYLGPNLEYTNILGVFPTNLPVGFQQDVTPLSQATYVNFPASYSVIATGTPPTSIEWYGNGSGIPSTVSVDYGFIKDTNTYAFFPTLAQNGENFYCIVSNTAYVPNATPYTAQSSTATLTVGPNLSYPQEILHGAVPTNALGNNSQANTAVVGGTITVGNNNVLVTHLGYCAVGDIVEGYSTLQSNHRIGIYAWNNGSNPTLLGWTMVTNGTPTNSEIGGYFWAPLDPPLVLSNSTKYLVSAEVFGNGGVPVDDWGNTVIISDLNSYFASGCAAYYANNATWPTAPTLGGYTGQMYTAPNLAILTNFAAVYVSNSAAISPNYISSASNITNVLGSGLTFLGYAEGQPPLYYPQWYLDGAPMAGQTNMTLNIPSVTNGGSYYLVVSNYMTSVTVTSAPVSVTILTSPQFTGISELPVDYSNILNNASQVATNLMTLYSGANPTFSVSVEGAAPLAYQWFTNGAAVAWGTNASYTFTNAQPTGTTNFYCIITNSYGSITTLVWNATVIADPTNATGGLAPYPQTVLSLNPIGYWRLNDTNLDGPDNDNGDNGYECHDYAGGNDGYYTNVYLGDVAGGTGYNPATDPSDTSVYLGDDADNGSDGGDQDANSIYGINFSSPAGTSKAFTVEAWVSGYASEPASAGIVTLGYGNGGEQFNLDCGAPTNAFRFFIRDAAGNTHLVNSPVLASYTGSPGPWIHLVGVVDEINSQSVSFYVNGQLVGTASVPSGSGILASGYPMNIGARSGAINTNLNDQFVGWINDVAVFNYALSSNQVAAEYAAGGTNVAPFETVAPQTTAIANATTPLNIPVTVYGNGPLSYQWVDTNTSVVVASGTTSGTVLNLNTVTNSTPVSFNGQTLALIVTNPYGSLTNFVKLTVYAQPVITVNIPSPVTVAQGQSYTYAVSVSGGTLDYQWYENNSGVLNQTNGTFSPSTATVSTNQIYVIVTNILGSVTSAVSTFIVLPPPSNPVASAIMNLNPASYWPMHEVEAAAQGDIETNYGTLGAQANGYYCDWMQPFSWFQHDFPCTIGGDTNSVFFSNPASGGGTITNAMLVNSDNPGTVLNPPFTVECWCFLTQITSYGDMWSQNSYEGLNAGSYGGGAGSVDGIRLDYGGNGSNEFTVYGYYNSSGLNSILVVTNSTLDTWEHLVVTCDVNTNFSVYTNGVLAGAFPGYTGVGVGKYSPEYWTPFAIGSGRGFTRSLPKTGVADLAIYTNIALPAATVLNHYQVGVNPNPPVSYFNTVLASNPPVFFRMDSPTWTYATVQPPTSILPVVQSYGSTQPAGVYSPGTAPGVAAGPNNNGVPWSGLGSATNVVPMSGVSSYGDVAYSPVLDPSAKFGTGSNAFSVIATFRGNPAQGTFEDIVGHSDASWRMTLGANAAGGGAAGSVQFTYSATASSTISCNDGKWHQAVGVYQPAPPNSAAEGQVFLYVDGQLNTVNNAASSNGIAAGSTADVLLGAAPDYTNNGVGVGRQLDGQVCDVAVFTNALTPAQVQAMYLVSGAPHAALAITSYLPITRTNLGTTNLMTLYAGASPNFYVSVSGVPVYYQWYTNGVGVGSATNPLLTLPNVQSSFTTYCIATNDLDSVTSVVWSASVIADPDPAGSFSQTIMSDNPVAYWRLNDAKGSLIADDYAGGANGQYGNQTTNGLPGVPIAGASPELAVAMNPTPTTMAQGTVTNTGIILNTNRITFICWVYGSASEPNPSGLFQNRSTAGSSGYQLVGSGSVNDLDYNWSGSASAYNYGDPYGFPFNTWGMAVMEITPQNAQFYLYGTTNGFIGAATNSFNSQIESFFGGNEIGSDPNGGTSRILHGLMNELAIFNYDLTPAQLAALYNAATNGALTTAFFVSPPQNATAVAHTTTSFSVSASSFLQPLTYQWYYNTTPSYTGAAALANGFQANSSWVTNATTAQLTITNVTFGSAGYYFVAVGNTAGTTNSAIASLAVTASIAAVKIGAAVTNGQLTLSWPTDHTGWQLQAQTNPVTAGISTNWVNYNPSTGTNQVVIPINLTNGTVFYRLLYTP